MSICPRTNVIATYNSNPSGVLSYLETGIIYDQSDDPEFAKLIIEKWPEAIHSANTGHNLSSYFRHVSDNYEEIDPSGTTLFGKGNMLGRHVTSEYFQRVCNRPEYTFLYNDPEVISIPEVSSLLYESGFLEINNSWFADIHCHRYFAQTNQLIHFLYQDSILPEWLLFAPGGCYIVPNNMILRHPKSLYQLLLHVVSYDFFPSEAWMVERIMHMIWSSPQPLRNEIHNYDQGFEQLGNLPNRINERLYVPTFNERIKSKLHNYLK